jgi:NAD-dependent deacetylase
VNRETIAVLTGAGISAESGLSTFRDSGGLWEKYSVYDVATPEAFAANPKLVLDFYNMRRRKVAQVHPNAAHLAIAELEQRFEVTVVTQNVDNLHERAGSTRVIHVHGEITKVRSMDDPTRVYEIGVKDIHLGDVDDRGSQLRPHIVWFGETVQNFEAAAQAVETADKVLVVGTSLTVYPAAGLADLCRANAEKVLVALEVDHEPEGFQFHRGLASAMVPQIIENWLRN